MHSRRALTLLASVLLPAISATKLIVPFKTGGGSDKYADLLVSGLGSHLGHGITKVNEPGHGGSTAWSKMNESTASINGSTWWMVNLPHIMTQPVAASATYRFEDIQVCAIGSRTPLVFLKALQRSAPRDLGEFWRACDRRGRPCSIGGAGNFTAQHMLLLELQSSGAPFAYQAFHSGEDAYRALRTGSVDAVVTSLPPAIQLQDEFWPLAVAAQSREFFSDHMTEAPLLKDLGISAMSLGIYRGIGLPSAAPPSVCQGISDELEQLHNSAVFVQTLKDNGIEDAFYRYGASLHNFLDLYRTRVLLSMCSTNPDSYFDQAEQRCKSCAESPEDHAQARAECSSESSSDACLADAPKDLAAQLKVCWQKYPGLLLLLGLLPMLALMLVLAVLLRGRRRSPRSPRATEPSPAAAAEEAALVLLPALCDAVVPLSRELRISEPCPKLANMLRQPADSIKGLLFSELMSEDDAVRFERHLQSAEQGPRRSLAPSLNANLKVSEGPSVSVSLFISSWVDDEGGGGHVVGICELQEPRTSGATCVNRAVLQDAKTANADTTGTTDTADSFSMVTAETDLVAAFGPIQVTFLGVTREFTIISCTRAFAAICNCTPEGSCLLDWFVESDRLLKWAQLHVNAFINSMTADAPRSIRVTLRVKSDVADLERRLSVTCCLTICAQEDEHSSSGSHGRSTSSKSMSERVLVTASLTRPRWESRGLVAAPPQQRARPAGQGPGPEPSADGTPLDGRPRMAL